MLQDNSQSFTLILGLGRTGLSCVRFFTQFKKPFRIMDNRRNPPELSRYLSQYPKEALKLGAFDVDWLEKAQAIVVSPGLPLKAVPLKYHSKMVSDIDLFQREVQKPVVAITGSNGKSTVAALLGEMAQASNVHAAVGANFGVPVLDLLLDRPNVGLYILELSSFQLELIHD
jgi:UDP-N-acetylmuramoylalanine--D-glutamate ligase